MNTEYLLLKSVKLFPLLTVQSVRVVSMPTSQTVYKSEINELRVSGYIRSGFAREVGGKIPEGLSV